MTADKSATECAAVLQHVHVYACQVCKKTSKEKLPALAKYSDRSKAEGASHRVQQETEYKSVQNPEDPVPPEEKVKAFKVCLLLSH